MQKYLFLVSREQKNPSYHFVPYRFWLLFVPGGRRQTNSDQVRSNQGP